MKQSHSSPVSILWALLVVSLLTASVMAQSGPARKIVYLRYTSTTPWLWIMNPDGTGQTQICNCSNVIRPVMSPDGLKVAFEMNGNIWAVNTDGTGLFNVTQNRGSYIEYASWGPDSRQIVFDMAIGTLTDVYRVNIDGTNLTRLTNAGTTSADDTYESSDFRAAWSPDGSKIAFYSNRYKQNVFVGGIFVAGPGGGSGYRVGNASGHPVWSPDSTRIVALLASGDGGCGIYNTFHGTAGFYVFNVSGGGPVRITDCDWHNGTDYEAAWSPNGKKLAFRLGDKIYTTNADGSGKKAVGLHTSTYWSPVWANDGKKVFFVYDNYPTVNNNEIFVVNADGSAQTNLTNRTSIDETSPNLGRGTACELQTVSPLPTQNVGSPWAYDLNGVNPNWSMTVQISANDGLVLKDVKLGQRYLAKQISVPYYYLQTSALARQRGELKPSSTDASMRSRIVDYSVTSDDEKLVVEGTYAIDQIGQSCLQVTQRYEFYKQGAGGPCELSEKLPCSRWKPTVLYLFSGNGGETLTSISIAERQHLRIDDNSYNTIGLFKDCDSAPPAGLGCGFNGIIFEKKINPLATETYDNIVRDGRSLGNWDNVHQTFAGSVEEPGIDWSLGQWSPFAPGCPECNHSHWRWGAYAGDFWGNGSILGLPSGSKQDVSLAVIRYHSGEEDPTDFKNLVQPSEAIRTYNTVGRNPLQVYRGSAPEEVVLWYSGTGYQNSDTFLGHGGFFNPTLPSNQLYSNSTSQDRISNVTASGVYGTGSTNVAPFDATRAGSLPGGYTQYATLSYDVTTTAKSSGPNTVTFSLPSVTDQTVFNNLRVFHVEQDPYDPNAVVWVDRTVLSPDPQAPDFTSKTINAKANQFGQFVVASLTNPQPPNTNVADLGVTTIASPDPVVVGNNVTYTLSISNSGPQTATGIKLADVLPATTDFVSVTPSQGTCKYTKGSVVCKLDSISSGGTGTVTILTKAGDGGAVQGQIVNTASVSANEGDPDSTNNTLTTSSTVSPNSNIPPTINITSPTTGNMFVGPANIPVTATASDTDGTIGSVEFFDNGQSIGLATTSGANQYTLNWTNVAFGNHSLIAIATDNAGKTATSSAANIIVNGLANVNITSPAAEAVFTAPATFTIQTSAWYSSGSSVITNVGLYANGNFIGTGTYNGSQYIVTWTNVYSGSYLLTAAATDNAGIVTVSNPVRVYVSLRVNQSPSVSITSPANNATYITPTSVTMTATATDSDGSVSGVDFYADGALIGSGAVSDPNQYSFTWANVLIGNHTLTAVASDNEGATTNSTDVTIKVVSPALFVAGSTTLNSSDAALKTRLEALNYTVTVKDGASVTAADANGQAVVIISSTVTPSTVGTKFRMVAVPVVTWESGLFTNMGMTGGTNKDFGTITRQTQITITNPAHPLAAGLSGNVTVVTVSGTLDWGKPNANASAVATVVGDSAKTVIFGYTRGAVMPGLTAPERRVGLFMYDTSAASFTTQGGLLFDAAIKWATGRI